MAGTRLSISVKAAVLGALAFLLMRLELPIVPGYPFLKYDPSNLPAIVAAFLLGLPAGLAVIAVRTTLFALFFGDPVGATMGGAASALFVVPAALVYRSRHHFRGGMAALAIGTFATALGMIPVNYAVISLIPYLPNGGIPFYCLTVVPAFNLARGALDSALTLVVYKRASHLLRG